MLTIKNLVRSYSPTFLTAALFLSGCAPPGPSALREGNRLLDRGHYSQAVEKLSLATTLLSSNALAWNCLGLACHYAGKTNEAERAYLRALQLDRDLAEAHYNLGCLWLETDNREGAKLELTAYTLRRPNSIDGLLKLGSAQLHSRDLNSAERSFADALRLSPQNPEALNGLGLIRFQRARPAEAAAFFNSALEKRPDYPEALLNLAIVSHQSLRDRSFALREYRRYLALKPTPPNAEAVADIAHELEQDLNPVAHSPAPAPPLPANTNNLPLSKPAATNAPPRLARFVPQPRADPTTNNAKPAHSPAPLKPAPTPMSTPPAPRPASEAVKPSTEPSSKLPVEPKPKPPIATLAHAEHSNPPPPAVRQPSGLYPYLSPAKPAPGNRTEAQRAFDQGLRNQEAHRLPETIQSYQLATKLDPSFYEAHYNLGHAATEAQNLPLALAAYEYALAIRPNSVDARFNFALILQKANFLSDAVKELERLLAQAPNDARAHLALANLYGQLLHQPAKARPHFLEVLELDPQNSQANAIRNWLAANPE